MSRFLYDGNGRALSSNREVDITFVDDLIADEPNRVGSSLEFRELGRASLLEKHYMMLARGIIGLMAKDELHKRRLASGLYVYTAERNVRLNPGIEAVMPEEDLVALNFKELDNCPDDVQPLRYDHMLWVAQALINYDFGVQHQEQAKASL